AFTTDNDPNFASGGLKELGRLDEVILQRAKFILRRFRAQRQALQCRLAAASRWRLDRLRANKGLSAELQDPFSDLRLAPNPYNVVSIIERGRSCPSGVVPDQQRFAPEPMCKPGNERRPNVVPLGIVNIRLQERHNDASRRSNVGNRLYDLEAWNF